MARGAKGQTSTSAKVTAQPSSSESQPQTYTLPVCQLPLPEYGRPQAIHWNDHGQACLVTETVLYILTPSIGYHPLLKPNQTSQVDQDALLDLPMASGDAAKASQRETTTHDFTGKAKPLDFFSSAIDMPAFQAVATNSGQQRTLDGQDHDAMNPGILGNLFRHAVWSPAGLGHYGSCLLAAIDSNCDVKIIAASNNPVVGPWVTQQALNCSQSVKTKEERFKVLADQAVSLAWSPALHRLDGAAVAALLAVGTRSGEVVIWHRSSADTAFSAPTRVQVGHSAVTSVAWSDQVNRGDDTERRSSITLAVALIQGPRLFDVTIQGQSRGGHPLISVQAQSVQPPLFADHPQISALRVIGRDQLLVCTPGQVRTWSTSGQDDRGFSSSTLPIDIPPRGNWSMCHLTISEEDEDTKDPWTPAISCTIKQGRPRVRLFLASRLEYHIPLSPLPASISPQGSVSTQRSLDLYSSYKEADYLLTDLSRQVESHQVLLGHALASQTLSDRVDSADVVSIVQSEGDTSAFRVRLDRSCKLSLLLSIRGESEGESTPSPTDILRRLLDDIQASTKREETSHVTPIQRHRALLALYHSSTLPLQKAFLVAMSESLAASADQGEETSVTVNQQNKLWLATWLQRQFDSLKPLSDTLRSAAQSVEAILANVYSKLLTRWLTGELQWLKDDASVDEAQKAASKTYIHRLIALACWLQSSLTSQGHDQSDELVHLIDAVVNKFNIDAAEVTSWRKGSEANLGEKCPACDAPVAFCPAVSSEMDRFKLPEWLQCPSGHVFKRCSLTFDILASSQVRTCEGCWNKTKQYDLQCDNDNGEGDIINAVLARTREKCVFCGCRWLSLV